MLDLGLGEPYLGLAEPLVYLVMEIHKPGL
jgi:hypothetical protein